MITVGEMHFKHTNIYLCVFGGVTKNDYDVRLLLLVRLKLDVNCRRFKEPIEYFDTFALANLSKAAWIIPNEKLSDAISPLEICSRLATYRDKKCGRDQVLVIPGAMDRSHNDKIVSLRRFPIDSLATRLHH